MGAQAVGPQGTWDPSLVLSGEGHPKGSWHLLYGGDWASLAGPPLLGRHVVPLEHQVPVKTCQPHKRNSVLTRVDVCSMMRTDVCSQHQRPSQLKNTGYLHETQWKTNSAKNTTKQNREVVVGRERVASGRTAGGRPEIFFPQNRKVFPKQKMWAKCL